MELFGGGPVIYKRGLPHLVSSKLHKDSKGKVSNIIYNIIYYSSVPILKA